MRQRYVHICMMALAMVAVCQTACGHRPDLPEATSAAWELYQQYAEREDLTVAFVGDYCHGDDTYNTIMLQAKTDEAWVALKREFSVVIPMGPPSGGDTVSPVMMASYLADPAVLEDSVALDSIVNNILNNILPDSMRGDRHVSALVMNDTVNLDSTPFLGQHDRLISVASADDKCGYLVSTDEEERILWLFFYASQDEFDRILTKIKR